MRKWILTVGLLAVLAFSAVPTFAQDTRSIADLVVADSRFDTLEAAVTAAGLVDTLDGEGPFTVFAPTDAAFDKLPAGTLDALLEDIPALTDILLYHVVAGEVPAAAVVTFNSARTVLGEDIYIEVTEDGVVLNGAVNVTVTDIRASNGVIHVIDTVLLPPQTGLNQLYVFTGDTPVKSSPTGELTGNTIRTCQTFFVNTVVGNYGYIPSIFGWVSLSSALPVPANYGQPDGPSLC